MPEGDEQRQPGGGPSIADESSLTRTQIRALPAVMRPPLDAFPPGVDPATYKYDEVTRQLKRNAIFPLFSMPDEKDPNIPYVSGRELFGVRVHESLHRFDVTVEMPRAGKSYLPINQVGQLLAHVHVTWQPVPDDFVAKPGVTPPPTPFDPTRSQRFLMHDGHFVFRDTAKSGFRGFASGRTFPSLVDGEPQIRIGAVVDVLEGYGKFKGLIGTVVVDGFIRPPALMALSIMPLFFDPSGRFQTRSSMPRLRPVANPDPEALFVFLLAEVDRADQPRLVPTSEEGMFAFAPRVPLRLVHIDCDVGGAKGLRSKRTLGPVVGMAEGTFYMGPLGAEFPVPFQSRDGTLTFFDQNRRKIGTLNADLEEGRAFPLDIPGAPMPVFRGGGIAPINQGTGMFEDAVGLVVINGFFSIFPRTMFVLYVIRLSDGSRRVRETMERMWM